MINMAASTQGQAHSMWSRLAKFKPEQISGLVDRIFSKYDQSFELLEVDDVHRRVLVKLKDGREISLPI